MTVTEMTPRSLARDPRTQFGRTVTDLLDEDFSTALVWAEISGRFFADAVRRHPDRVVNVGIREQLLVNVGAGLALTGLRPGRLRPPRGPSSPRRTPAGLPWPPARRRRRPDA